MTLSTAIIASSATTFHITFHITAPSTTVGAITTSAATVTVTSSDTFIIAAFTVTVTATATATTAATTITITRSFATTIITNTAGIMHISTTPFACLLALGTTSALGHEHPSMRIIGGRRYPINAQQCQRCGGERARLEPSEDRTLGSLDVHFLRLQGRCPRENLRDSANHHISLTSSNGKLPANMPTMSATATG